MVYGVDQCRVCGARISPKGPEVAEDQAEANRKPMMPEKEWRRRGYLAPPTKKQIRSDPSNGCCPTCGMKELRRHSKFGLTTLYVALFFVVFATTIVFVITFLPH